MRKLSVKSKLEQLILQDWYLFVERSNCPVKATICVRPMSVFWGIKLFPAPPPPTHELIVCETCHYNIIVCMEGGKGCYRVPSVTSVPVSAVVPAQVPGAGTRALQSWSQSSVRSLGYWSLVTTTIHNCHPLKSPLKWHQQWQFF